MMRGAFLCLGVFLAAASAANPPATQPAKSAPSAKDVAEGKAFVPPPAIKGDPMDWSAPVSPPPLRELLDAAAYNRQAKAVRSGIDLKSLTAPGRPLDGVLIKEVVPKTQAASIGLRAGDILLSLDGSPLGWRTGNQDWRDVRLQAAQQLVFWSPADGHKSVTLKSQVDGFSYYTGWRALDSYVRLPDRDAAWDDAMLVAAGCFMDDPVLAETALCRAQKAGYHGRELAPIAAEIAYERCRFDDAVGWGWQAFSQNAAMGRPFVQTVNDAALLSFKLEQSLELARRYPAILGEEADIAAIVASYRAKPKSSASNPIDQLPSLNRERAKQFHPVIAPAAKAETKAGKWAIPFLNRDEPLHFEHVKTDSFGIMLLKPTHPNAALTVRYNVHATERKAKYEGCGVAFGLFDNEQMDKDGPAMQGLLFIFLTTDGEIQIHPFGRRDEQVIILPAPKHVKRMDEGGIRIVVLHNRCEVALSDGRRLYYGPALADESKRKLGVYMEVTGVSGHIYPPTWEKISDSAPAGRKP